MEILRSFEQDPFLKEMVNKSDDGKFYAVTRPIRLDERQGCMMCHGSPSTSPWKNGKDILGYQMEDMKNGALRGAYTVMLNMKPVEDITSATTKQIAMGGAFFTSLALVVGLLLVRSPMNKLATLPVIQQASAPATIARRPSEAKSPRRFGAIALSPPI